MKFENPVQVKFYAGALKSWLGGIAYKDYVICGCCGAVIPIETIYKEATEDEIEDEPIEKLSWITISDELLGN